MNENTLASLGDKPLAALPQDDEVRLEFSEDVKAIPFPPDASQLEFDETFEQIQCESRSSLGSLAVFYRTEMTRRGWNEDEQATSEVDDSVEMTFRHQDAVVEMELASSGDTVQIEMDTEGLTWEGTNDPRALVSAGIPQPRAFVYLQQYVSLPAGVFDLKYRQDGCQFKCDLTKERLFQHLSRRIIGLGFQESRQPIVTSDRRYTEFQKEQIELSVNIFDHEAGCRAILSYQNSTPEELVPPLPEVAAWKRSDRVMDSDDSETTDEESVATPAKRVIDVSNNKGSATVWYGSDKYEFQHVAAYHNEYYEWTILIFADKPIPMHRLQQMLAENPADFAFFNLYEFESPSYLLIQFDDPTRSDPDISMTLSVPGVGIGGHTLESSLSELKIVDGRVSGSIQMEAEKILRDPVRFEATIEAGVIGADTTLDESPEDPIAIREPGVMESGGLLFPDSATSVSSSGTRYRRSGSTQVDMQMADVIDFYRQTLSPQNWQEDTGQTHESDDSAVLAFQGDQSTMVIQLSRNGRQTAIEVALRDVAGAKADGILPEPGKARLIMGNASDQDFVITIGTQDYQIKAGQGADDPRDGLNYNVAPGTYKLIIKIPGQNPQTEELVMDAGTAWGVLAIPGGEYFAEQIF